MDYSSGNDFTANFIKVLQVHLMFSGDIVGTEGKNDLYGMCYTVKEMYSLTNLNLRLYNEIQSRLTDRSHA